MTNEARRVLARLWVKACEEDGIDPTAKFVIFSKGNKYAQMYNRFSLEAMVNAVRLSGN